MTARTAFWLRQLLVAAALGGFTGVNLGWAAGVAVFAGVLAYLGWALRR